MSNIDQITAADLESREGWAFLRPRTTPARAVDFAPDFPSAAACSGAMDLAPRFGSARSLSLRHLYRQRGKRVFDVVFIILGLPAILPLILLLALLVMRDGGAPFFGHLRIGRDGRPFRCWKLRSMLPDAEARLTRHLALNPAARAEWAASFKLEEDPRITRLGQFLRRSSLDELPQVWNILKGEMSVVGPRPVVGAELDRYGAGRRHYHALRPGLTGLWQVSGRNDISYDERVVLDVAYARNHSLKMDLAIILATVRVVLMRTGK